MGRKPKYDKPMTATERSRLRRERLKDDGSKVLHFSLDGEIVAKMDELVEFYELSGRAQVVSDLLHRPLRDAIKLMNEWKTNNDLPTTDEINDMNKEDSEAISCAKRIMWLDVSNKINNNKTKI